MYDIHYIICIILAPSADKQTRPCPEKFLVARLQ